MDTNITRKTTDGNNKRDHWQPNHTKHINIDIKHTLSRTKPYRTNTWHTHITHGTNANKLDN